MKVIKQISKHQALLTSDDPSHKVNRNNRGNRTYP